MENLAAKIEAKQDAIKDAEKKFKSAKEAYKNGGTAGDKANLEKCKKALERLMEQLEKLEIQRTDKDENKTIALGTSKLNYLDPRYSFELQYLFTDTVIESLLRTCFFTPIRFRLL